MSDILKVGDRIVDLVLPGLDGSTVDLREFSGRKYILFMWASW